MTLEMNTLVSGAVLLVLIAGCGGPEDDPNTRHNVAVDPPVDPNKPVDKPAPQCSVTGKVWTGFAGTNLVEKRDPGAIGADRARIKPYSALASEYERTIGTVPASLGQAEASFGAAPDRFDAEPQSNAIALYSAFRVAFDGCLTFTATAPDYAAAPANATSSSICTTLARKFWSRAPDANELQSCTQVAMVDSAMETDPRRRWAYACATLLSSSGFLTY